jgi:hypothetical protein
MFALFHLVLEQISFFSVVFLSHNETIEGAQQVLL